MPEIERNASAPCRICGKAVQDGTLRLDTTGRPLFERSLLLAFAAKLTADSRASQICNSCLESELQRFIDNSHLEAR